MFRHVPSRFDFSFSALFCRVEVCPVPFCLDLPDPVPSSAVLSCCVLFSYARPSCLSCNIVCDCLSIVIPVQFYTIHYSESVTCRVARAVLHYPRAFCFVLCELDCSSLALFCCVGCVCTAMSSLALSCPALSYPVLTCQVGAFHVWSRDVLTCDGLVRRGTLRHGTARHDAVRFGTMRKGTVRQATIRYGAARHGMARHDMAPHGTAR